MITAGSFCSGYEGAGLALEMVWPGQVDLRWVCDIDKDASKVLAHRFPTVPNHGNLKECVWALRPRLGRR